MQGSPPDLTKSGDDIAKQLAGFFADPGQDIPHFALADVAHTFLLFLFLGAPPPDPHLVGLRPP